MASRGGGCVIQTNASASSNCGSANCGSLNRRHHPIGSDQVARNSSTLNRRSAAAAASTASSSHIHHHVTASGTLNRCPNSAEASLLRRSSSTSNRYFFDQLYRLNLFLDRKMFFTFNSQIYLNWQHWHSSWRNYFTTILLYLTTFFLQTTTPHITEVGAFRGRCADRTHDVIRNWRPIGRFHAFTSTSCNLQRSSFDVLIAKRSATTLEAGIKIATLGLQRGICKPWKLCKFLFLFWE